MNWRKEIASYLYLVGEEGLERSPQNSSIRAGEGLVLQGVAALLRETHLEAK